MRQFFQFSEEETLWFSSWKFKEFSFGLSCVGLFVMVMVFYYYQIKCKPRLTQFITETVPNLPRLQKELWYLLRALLVTMEVSYSFLLMLAIMTYNAWWCISAILSCFISFYVFRHNYCDCVNEEGTISPKISHPCCCHPE